ncbi:MAG TPA: GFA family protein [Steroidobacteraceae bacterium]|nr:GFA family protein [Steroidobacteraceae bacterium]
MPTPVSPAKHYTGRCLCGAVRYECGEPVSAAGLCHCESCRRASGAHAVAWATVRQNQFRFIAGTPQRYASSPPVQRTFCGTCGTPLTYWHRDDVDTIDITVSSLDDANAFAPASHTWMIDAPAWDRPHDDLSQFRTTIAAGAPFDP